jgi:signal transduction histidine kinase
MLSMTDPRKSSAGFVLVAFRVLGRIAAGLAVLMLSFAAVAADHSGPARILIINSFSRENSPHELFASYFRSELAKRASAPVAFYDISLDGAHFDPARDAGPVVRFLRDRFVGVNPDLVVPFGPLANAFYAKHREELFPESPVLAALAEERVMQGVRLGPRDASVPVHLDIPRLFDHILQVQPQTSTIAIILGDSPIERFWVNVLRTETKAFEGRVSFLYLNKLSLEEVAKRVATLPSHSAILFVQMFVDGAGVSRQQDQVLAMIREAANAPIFGLYASELGKGLVGGPLISEEDAAVRAAKVAVPLLAGEALPQAALQPVELGAPAYDWRELQRWGIPESRLPQGSTIVFRQPSLWKQYKWTIVAAAGIVILQSVLLAGVLVQRTRRRRAEDEALLLSGRILTAHEDEHRNLARELHDDVTPRLARLAIEAARMQRDGQATPRKANDLSMHDELVRLSEDVHAFSYRLHPTVLDDLGLVDALHSECDKASHGQAIRVDLKVGEVPERIPREFALCLFRIAQEALRNVYRHAKAKTVSVSLQPRNDGLELIVADDGVGYDVDGSRERPSLGHASMRERVRQVGGDLEIRSARGSGTTIVAWVPLPGGFA